MRTPWKFVKHYTDRMRLSQKSFKVYVVLRILVILTAIRVLLWGNYEGFFLCILSLILFLLPSFFAEKLKLYIPPAFEIIIYLFIYAAEILGEVDKFYTAIPGWDTMLHTLNGFLCAAIGFSLVDLLNRNSKRISLSPVYLSIVAFCFSMTIGVMWEFFEFTMDQLFYLDMQKDFIVKNIGSVTLDPEHAQNPYMIWGIQRTIVEAENGLQTVIEGGYLDIGILDTMKDLLVNFVGAVVFSGFGFLYVSNRESGWFRKIVGKMKLRRLSDEEIKDIEQKQKKRR